MPARRTNMSKDTFEMLTHGILLLSVIPVIVMVNLLLYQLVKDSWKDAKKDRHER